MRKVVAEITVSLNGFIECPRGEVDRMASMAITGKVLFAKEFLSRFDTVFFGRVTYEKFAFNEITVDQPEAEQTFYTAVKNMRKYVFSRTKKHVNGNGMVINHSIQEEVIRIREEEGKDIWLCGGARIIQTFAMLDLIDEYMLIVHPVAVGAGKSFFGNITKYLNFRLLKTETLDAGVLILSYKPEPVTKLFYDRSI